MDWSSYFQGIGIGNAFSWFMSAFGFWGKIIGGFSDESLDPQTMPFGTPTIDLTGYTTVISNNDEVVGVFNSYTGMPLANSYTNEPVAVMNPITGSYVNPLWVAPPPPIDTSQSQYLAYNDATQTGYAHETGFDTANDSGGVTEQWQDKNGNTTEVIRDGDGNVVAYRDMGVVGPSSINFTDPLTFPSPAPGTPVVLPPDFVPPQPGDPDYAPPTAPTAAASTPLAAGPEITMPVAAPNPITAAPPTSPIPSSPAPSPDLSQTPPPLPAGPANLPPRPGPEPAPYDPMAGSPLAELLLYGSDSPIRDFLTDDRNLQVMQNAALTVSTAALTGATVLTALEVVAPGALAGIEATVASIGSGMSAASGAATTAAPGLATAATGILAADPDLPAQIQNEADALGGAFSNLAPDLPALGQEVEGFLPKAEESDTSVAEEAATVFQDAVRNAKAFLDANLGLVLKLGQSGGKALSDKQVAAAGYQLAGGNPGFARALYGNALEALVHAFLEDGPGAGKFVATGQRGGGTIDFEGVGEYAGYTFELTTDIAEAVIDHAGRLYMQQPGAMMETYTPPF